MPTEVENPQPEAISSTKSEATEGRSDSMKKSNDELNDSGESVQSLYAPQPIEDIGSDFVSLQGVMLFQRGVNSLNLGEIDKALEIWRQAHTEFPGHAASAHNLGVAAGAAQQYGEAMAAFRLASELDESLIVSNLNSVCISIPALSYQARVDDILGQSRVLREQGKCLRAEKLARLLLDEYPNSAAGLAELALVLVRRAKDEPQKADGFLAQALKHAQRAIFLEPTLPTGFEALATVQEYLGTHREAFVSSQRLLELQAKPDLASLLFAGEHALRAARADNDKELVRVAVGYADQVIAEKPDNVRAWVLRADANSLRVLDGQVTFEQNLADFERILQLEPTNAHALEMRDFLQAQRYHDEVFGKDKLLLNDALGYLKANENKNAVPHLKQILAEEPDNRPALSNLSLALRRLRRFDEALSVQSHLATLDPTPESWRLVATIALQLKNYEQAKFAYLQVLQLLPNEASSHRDVATTLEKMGRGEEAIPFWRRVVELSPEGREDWFHLGKNLLEAGCSQRPVKEAFVCEAIPALNKARVLDGGNTEIMSQLAVGIAEIGDTEMAFGYATHVAGHDPVAHSVLQPILTDIQSRRLAQGLASKPLSSELVPLLAPPRLPVQNMGDPLVAQPFSPVYTRSIAPWLVGVVGLLAIFGVWGLMQISGLRYKPLPPEDLTPPAWSQPPIVDSQPPVQSFGAAAPDVGFANALLEGMWTGSLGGDAARLVITTHIGNTFNGVLLIDGGDKSGLSIQVVGDVTGDTISWSEKRILSNPREIDWALGEERGTIRQGRNGLEIRGGGNDGRSEYMWAFTHASNSTIVPSSNSSLTNSVPAGWTRLPEEDLGFSLNYPVEWSRSIQDIPSGKRISLNAPEANVSCIIDVSTTTDPPLSSWKKADARLRETYGSDYYSMDMGSAPLGGQDGYKWEFRIKRPNETQLYKLQRSVIYNNRQYRLYMVAPNQEYWKWSNYFNTLCNSFRFQ